KEHGILHLPGPPEYLLLKYLRSFHCQKYLYLSTRMRHFSISHYSLSPQVSFSLRLSVSEVCNLQTEMRLRIKRILTWYSFFRSFVRELYCSVDYKKVLIIYRCN